MDDVAADKEDVQKRKNVLMIIVDDLRPEMNAYSGEFAPAPVRPTLYTPNLDKLAEKSAVFMKAYVQYPLCGPSRASFLTSRRPETLKQFSFDSFRATANKDIVSLPQHFKNNGFSSIGMGKIFDPPIDRKHGIHEEKYSFSEPWYDGSTFHYWTHELRDHSWLAVDPKTEKRIPLPDNQVLNKTLTRIKSLGQNRDDNKPFFLSVGFHKPHCPYIFPEKYLEHYPEEVIQMPDNPQMPTDFPEEAWANYHNLRKFHDLSGFTGDYNTTLPVQTCLYLRRAYYSAVTYVDDLIGQVLDELEKQGLADDTIITLLGDHGYHLGENAEWTKQTTLELSARAPLMIHIPGITKTRSNRKEFVEFVDIYPTLVEAAGLTPLQLCPEVDSAKTPLCTEGTSLLSLIQDKKPLQWKERVFTTQARFSHDVMGRSMRTPKFRYTEWRNHKQEVTSVELYDHDVDPQENHNIAKLPRMNEVKLELNRQLEGNWRSAMPVMT
ncbi:hypothetical protein CAPTEDRAFT_112288 [Capitella teleta]|uniref:Sulfatase N-terminal domain-containing protein n=1 Tax=Capitella teleta TaxID=283909 RepID=R7UAK4_CAPTE|nr:hypothetical protein CAPTEDRAFT_112288 [Capitella teleta]|eukprot:ELU03161.1 hypothetical protein CAPTEDRAFT_112288 [Capitella teleta]